MPLHEPHYNPATEAQNAERQTERPAATNGLNGPFGRIDFREIGTFGADSMKAGLHAQQEMLSAFEDVSRAWLARATSETELAFALPARLTATRTFPDAVSAYQEWLKEWMNMLSEDSRQLLSDGTRMMGAGARCWTGSMPATPPAMSS
jgi:hypothetical protein